MDPKVMELWIRQWFTRPGCRRLLFLKLLTLRSGIQVANSGGKCCERQDSSLLLRVDYATMMLRPCLCPWLWCQNTGGRKVSLFRASKHALGVRTTESCEM